MGVLCGLEKGVGGRNVRLRDGWSTGWDGVEVDERDAKGWGVEVRTEGGIQNHKGQEQERKRRKEEEKLQRRVAIVHIIQRRTWRSFCTHHPGTKLNVIGTLIVYHRGKHWP
jgi:hypothetical protein